MTTREKIAEVIENELGHAGLEYIAGAILEALPDMIAPLVWKQSKNFRVRTTKVNLGLQYGMQISLSGGAVWSVNTVKGWHNALDEHEAIEHINTHYRAAIMAAFTGETR
jgi:hypothetical protein